MGTAANKKRWHNKAKDTLYNFHPEFDRDIQASLKNLQDAETKLDHKWTIGDN
jgi:phage-related protein